MGAELRENLRLFAACPLEPGLAAQIHGWTVEHLSFCRAVQPASLHVTVLFFGEVDSKDAEWLANQVRAIQWPRLRFRAGRLSRMGARAVAIELEPIDGLADAVARAATGGGAASELSPLAEMARFRAKRERRQESTLRWHATIGRLVPQSRFQDVRVPPWMLACDRLALFRSHLSPAAARYEIVAESGRGQV